MRKYLFEKASKAEVKITVETDNMILLQVGTHSVIVQYKNRKLDFSCDCIAQSFDTFCSHKIAALTYLTNGKKIN